MRIGGGQHLNKTARAPEKRQLTAERWAVDRARVPGIIDVLAWRQRDCRDHGPWPGGAVRRGVPDYRVCLNN